MSRPVLLLTRPRPSSEEFRDMLGDGIAADIVISPLIDIEPLGEIPALDGYASVIVTSAHAARCAGDALRDTRVYAVGERTAEAARMAGADAVCLGGTVAEFVRNLQQVETPAIYLRGRHVTTDLAAVARDAGHDVIDMVVYDQVARGLSDTAQAALLGPSHVIAPVFSRRSAELLCEAIAGRRAPVHLVAISSAVAEVVPKVRLVTVAASPDAAAMKVAVLEAIESAGLAGSGRALRL